MAKHAPRASARAAGCGSVSPGITMKPSIAAIVLFLSAGQVAGAPSKVQQPNVVVIMADDLGYETIGANGGTSYRTPVLDGLARTGARFTQGYAQPLCTPTRVQLMTGQYNVRNYIDFGTLNKEAMTFGNLFKNAGYTTAIAGKWQLGQERDLPKHFGFDEAYLWRHMRHRPRYANPGLEINGVDKDYRQGEYGPDIVSDHALDFIARKKGVPFFLYYPMILPHAPYQPTPDSKTWDPKARGEDRSSNEHFGDMVAYMDELVGKLVAKLDTLGLRNDTLLVFLGDNGTGRGTPSRMGDRVVMGGKGLTTAAGMHVPFIVNWPGRVLPGKVYADLVDSTDVLPTVIDAAGIQRPAALTLDGRSLMPLARGDKGLSREWIYSWYSPREKEDMTVREFAFTSRFKLYRSGEFFDLVKDRDEKHPLTPASLGSEAAAAAKHLAAALDRFKNARPAELDALFEGAAGSGKKRAEAR